MRDARRARSSGSRPSSRRWRPSCEELSVVLPNIPEPEAPEGETEDDAVVIREVGERPEFAFEPRDHLELGTALGLIDMEQAAQVSGSRFAYLLGDLVLVELALVRFALDLLSPEGFVPVTPPVLVREPALHGTGFFPAEREMIYEVPQDELFLVGTSEVSLAALHAGQILAAEELPLRYVGISTCFRREAGAARQGHARDLSRAPVRQGRDVRLLRARAFAGRAPAPARDPGADPRGARDPVQGRRHPGRRPRRARRAQVRLRGLDPEPGPLPRGHLDFEHDRLPGPPPRTPATALRPRRHRNTPHRERHRRRDRPHADRPDREPPGRGRRRHDAAGAGRRGRAGLATAGANRLWLGRDASGRFVLAYDE